MTMAMYGTPAASHWQRIGVRPHQGLATPLFSLRSEFSSGIREYPDIMRLADWCADLGMDVIQLLPLNDTGPDASPYNAMTAFGLNPLHLGLEELTVDSELKEIRNQLKQLEAFDRVRYQPLRELKELFLRTYFRRYGNAVVESEGFQQFCKNNPWLDGFARFKALKERNQWRSWRCWENHGEAQEAATYHCFIQYLCFRQLEKAKQYANKKGIFLKGDIPILISRESADVWQRRTLFNLKLTAGAPPDMFSDEGQNWGFPIYNWDEMQHQNYNWWRTRLRITESLYDLYRIDHVVGFYRFWGMPAGETGREGKYIPEDPHAQMQLGERSMRVLLKASEMLPIGEDLGVVPPEVRRNLRSLGICGTKVIRWERMWDEDQRFIKFEDYIPESMTTVSTHDSETLAQWWERHPNDGRDYCRFKGWEYSESLTGGKRLAILHDSHHTASLFHINLLQEYLALIPELADERRINIPGKQLETNWTYRYKLRLEEYMAHEKLNQAIKSVLR